MLKQFFCLIALLTFFSINSQSKKNKDKQSIKEMCGCFEIQFDFAETFMPNYDEDYTPSKNYSTSALEWAQLVMEDKNFISIQHILITGNEENPYIVKHWRQAMAPCKAKYTPSNGSLLFRSSKIISIKYSKLSLVFQLLDDPPKTKSGEFIPITSTSL